MRYEGGQYYCKSEEEMRKLFPYAQEAIDNTHKIAERCNVEIEFGVTKLPKYEVPEGFDSWTYLNHLCREGFKTRYPDDDGTLSRRLDYELGVIKTMGYVDYFLIVSDFIGYAKSQGIPVGPGRNLAVILELAAMNNRQKKMGYNAAAEFTALMRRGSELFGKLERLDFIKCDIEGYEVIVMREMRPLLERHRPTVLIETGGENRPQIIELFTELDYKGYTLENGREIPLAPDTEKDIIFRQAR